MYRRTAHNQEYTTIPLDIADSFVPDNENLERSGRLGKLVARYRNRCLCLLVLAAVVAAFGAVSFFVWLVVQSLRVRASGLELDLVDKANLSSVALESGVVVWKLVEPVQQMSDVDHAALLLSDARFRAYRPLDRDEVTAGYLSWLAAEDRPAVNFTLAHMERLVRLQTNRTDTPCVCYAAYGLPYNIVYLSDNDDVAYEPKIVSEFADRVVRVKTECRLHDLLQEARAGPPPAQHGAAAAHTITTNASGIIEYMRKDGRMSRQKMDLPLFPCVKHCIGFFVK